MDIGVRRVLVSQALITAFVVGVSAYYSGGPAAAAAFVGGMIAVAGTVSLAAGVWRTAAVAARDVRRAGRVLMLSLLPRYAAVIAALVIALAALRLSPLPLLTGFLAAQLGYLAIGGIRTRTRGKSRQD